MKTTHAPSTAEPLLLTVIEAGELLGVGRTTVYDLLARGELVAVRIGRCRRIPRQTLEAYVDRLVEARDRIAH